MEYMLYFSSDHCDKCIIFRLEDRGRINFTRHFDYVGWYDSVNPEKERCDGMQ